MFVGSRGLCGIAVTFTLLNLDYKGLIILRWTFVSARQGLINLKKLLAQQGLSQVLLCRLEPESLNNPLLDHVALKKCTLKSTCTAMFHHWFKICKSEYFAFDLNTHGIKSELINWPQNHELDLHCEGNDLILEFLMNLDHKAPYLLTGMKKSIPIITSLKIIDWAIL